MANVVYRYKGLNAYRFIEELLEKGRLINMPILFAEEFRTILKQLYKEKKITSYQIDVDRNKEVCNLFINESAMVILVSYISIMAMAC